MAARYFRGCIAHRLGDAQLLSPHTTMTIDYTAEAHERVDTSLIVAMVSALSPKRSHRDRHGPTVRHVLTLRLVRAGRAGPHPFSLGFTSPRRPTRRRLAAHPG